ncbi:MAG TPA: hypothetical protein VGH04_14565, partial [Gemmatimonadaceae bacterium]
MIRRVVRMRSGISATLLALAMPLAPVSIAAQQSGVEFDVKTVMSVSGAMSGMLSGMTPGYSGHGFALGKRLRIDIVDGGLPPLADKGDYLLFDSTGITVVHPSKKEFVPIPLDFPNKAIEQMQALGMSITLGDMAFKFDTLPGIDTIAGYPTHHYRQTIGYTVTMDGMGVSQQMKSQATNEYWMATVPGLGTSPLQQASQLGGAQNMSALPQFKELAEKIDAVSRRMTGSAVRVRATTSSDAAGAGTMGLDMTSEMSNIKRPPVA